MQEKQAEEYVATLKELAVYIALQGKKDKEVFSVKGMIDILEDMPENLKNSFVRSYVLQNGRSDSRNVRELLPDKEGQKYQEPIQGLFTLSAMTGQNLSLVEALYRDLKNPDIGDYTHIRDLAKKGQKEWSTYLNEKKVLLPRQENGKRLTQTAYAEELASTFKKAFPMVDFVHALQTSRVLPQNRQPSTGLSTFFAQNPDFHLQQKAIDNFWADANLKGISKAQQAGLLQELRSWQRVYKLLPDDEQRNEKSITLMAMEPPLDSAMKIANLSKSGFTAIWADARKKSTRASQAELRAEADMIYKRARLMAFMVSATSWKYSAALDVVRPMVVPPAVEAPATKEPVSTVKTRGIQNYLPDTNTLLDQPYYREVLKCQSVLSPAAYLQELLAIPIYNTGQQLTVGDQLKQKRPDILLLQPTTQNTETQLPYIDLVNEILERLVSYGQEDEWNFDLQTTYSAEELELRAENEFSPAYIKPATYRYSMSLPWDKWYTEARLYLDYLDIPLYQLIEAFRHVVLTNNQFDYTKRRINQLNAIPAMRSFWGLTEPAYIYIKDNLSGKPLNTIFGISEDQLETEGKKLSVLMPLLGFWQGNKKGDTGAKELILLRQTLGTRYIQDAIPSGQPPIDILFTDDPLEGELSTISKDIIIRLAKFERLRRTLGWTPMELHQGIMTFAKRSVLDYDLHTDIFNDKVLLQLSHVERLRKAKKGASVVELLSWWGPMESGAGFTALSSLYEAEELEGNHKTLYEKVFLNTSLYSELGENAHEESEWKYFELRPDGYELNRIDVHSITQHQSLVAAALHLSETDLVALINFLAGEHKWIVQPIIGGVKDPIYYFFRNSLSLKNLSVLYKAVSMARYLGITIPEFILAYRLLNLEIFKVKETAGFWGMPPSVNIETEETVLFVEFVEQIKRSPFSIRDLAYLWQHHTETGQELELVHQRIRYFIEQLKTGLDTAENQQPDPQVELLDPIEAILNGMVQKGFSAADVRDFKIILEGHFATLPREPEQEITDEALAEQRIRALFPTLSEDRMADLIKFLVTNRPLSFNNFQYSKLFYIVNVVPPDTYLRQRQEIILKLIEQYGFADDTIQEVRTVLEQDGRLGSIGGEDSELMKWARQKLEELYKVLPAQLPPNLHLPTLNSHIAGLFKGRDVLFDYTYPLFIKIISKSLNTAIYLNRELEAFSGLPTRIIQALLHSILNGSEAGDTMFGDFLNWLSPQSSTSEEEIHQHLLRLEKISWLIKEWNLTPEEIEYLAENGSDFHNFDWNQVPVAKDEPALNFEQWRGLMAFVSVRDQLSVKKGDILAFFRQAKAGEGGAAEEAFQTLASLLNMEYDEVKTLASHIRYLDLEDGQEPKDGKLRIGVLRNGESLQPLLELARLAKRSGRSSSTLQYWVEEEDANCIRLEAAFPESFDDLLRHKITVVEQIRNAVKAQCSEEQWRQVARQFRDQMRILQRDHLMEVITGVNRTFSFEGFYNAFLLDPQMDPCMKTTRVKQAISSVQLYIRRLLMGLEEVTSDINLDDLRTDWKWKKHYRVWEAQRKVFLYPENWIEPELRDNKTPFFEDFEGELAQGELNDKNIEKAYKNYLRKVDEVGDLEIAAFTETIVEEEGLELKRFYVIGRTRLKPHSHFFRIRNESNIWSPWERIDLDIESEVVLLTVYRGAPYLFWPSIKERVQKLGQDNPDDENNDKNNYLPVFEIQFNWSRYEDGRWQPKKKADGCVELMYDWKYQELFEKPEELIRYNIGIENDRLSIELFIPSVNYTNVEQDPVFPITSRFTWDEGKFKEHFAGIKKLANDIDWSYIYGENFNNEPAQNLTSAVESLMNSAEKITSNNLYFRKDNHFDYIHKLAVGKIEDRNPERIEAEWTQGLLGTFFDVIPFQFNNNKSHFPDNPPSTGLKGLKDDDKGKIDIALDKFNSIQDSDIDLEDHGYAYARPPGYLKYIRFARIEFTGYKLVEEIRNATGYVNGINFDSSITGYGNIIEDEYLDLPYNYPFQEITLQNNLLWVKSNKIKFTDRKIGEADIIFFSTSKEPYSLLFSNGVSNRFSFSDSNGTFFTTWDQFHRKSFSPAHPIYSKLYPGNVLKLDAHFHPFISSFNSTMDDNRLDAKRKFEGVLNLREQNKSLPFYELYDLSTNISEIFNDYISISDLVWGKPNLSVDFKGGPYSLYNWEIFFHIPFTIAVRLSQNKKFAEAQQWFHYIFDPFGSFSLDDSDPESPSRYWNFLELHKLKGVKSLQEIWDDVGERESQLSELAEDPFQPHRIARDRLSAYQKAVVMKYLDNLIAWGDHLFEQDTIETINEATLLYVLAAKILGPRPRLLPSEQAAVQQHALTGSRTMQLAKYSEGLETAESQMMLSVDFQAPGFATFALEQAFPITQWHQQATAFMARGIEGETIEQAVFNDIPHNSKLLSYWDTVAGRLFKIRHCQNIEGLARELPIFEPPIDPGLLVRGSALGVDISELLSGLYAPLPPYRFRVMLQKANEFCADVRSLGGALLSALEKKDAEELSLLRAGHEKQMLRLAREIKKQQISELRENLKSAQVSLEMAEGRYEFYSSRKFENSNEKQQVKKLDYALVFNVAGQLHAAAASVSYLIANYHTNTDDGRTKIEMGGRAWGDGLKATSEFLNMVGGILSHQANMHSIQASRERRWDDWQFQARQAKKEIKQIRKQILAAEIRLAIAEKELSNHEKQQEQAEEIETFMLHKFTNRELYHWMISQISGIYFQTYKMALEVARMAQRCYRYERGDEAATFIGAAYWDNLKKGLLAGEKLQFDLRRMEQEYLRKNTRDLELTKHISLKALDPVQLNRLRYEGKCTIQIPELLFDLDYPGHYYRRIKSMSISIPAIVGPYSGVNATLRLLKSKTRIKDEMDEQDETALSLDQMVNTGQIALSSGQSDSGLFELNYNDERYLPFELRGVVSTWELEFPGQLEQFDRTTISDVIFHMRYTARQGDETFEQNVRDKIDKVFNGENPPENLAIALDIRREFPALWQPFISSWKEDGIRELSLNIAKDYFPYLLRPFSTRVKQVSLFCELTGAPDANEPDKKLQLDIQAADASSQPVSLTRVMDAEDRYFYLSDRLDLHPTGSDPKSTGLGVPGGLKIQAENGVLPVDKLKELIVVLHLYTYQ
ncbi:MAG: hypothetical protein H6560_13135 [Lewinellaceae bacterium]|nr:hypothetical protein [Lewinellaceae bacterium]